MMEATMKLRRDRCKPGMVVHSSHYGRLLLTEVDDSAQNRSDKRAVGFRGHLHANPDAETRTERYPAATLVDVEVASVPRGIEPDVPAPVRVILAGRTRFTVPSDYGDAEIDGVREWATFEEAVAACRSQITRFGYPGLLPTPGDRVEDGMIVRYSRGTVALRQEWRDAPQGAALGSDGEVLRWEVTPERVVLVPPFQGFGHAEDADARALGEREAGKHGWA